MDVIGYTADGTIRAEIEGQEWFVPDDPANRHRQMIAEWEGEGNTIPPYVAPAPDPAAVTLTRRQLRLALLSIGVTAAEVEAQIDAIPDPTDKAAALIEWQDASTYERNHPLLIQVAQNLNLSPAQVDALWLDAAAL